MITIKHNFFVDLKLFFDTLFKKRWLDENGYYYHLSIIDEYRKINFLNLSEEIKKELAKYNFINKLNEDYIVYLTKYGALGSFDEPNTVYANIQREPKKISLTIIHEIIHLMFEKELLFQNLSHEEKETAVEKKFKEVIINN